MDEPAVARGSVPRSTRARVREVFAGKGFRHLFGARGVSQFGDGLFQFAAAAVLLFDQPGPNPALRLAGIVGVTLIPFSIVAPFTGVFIDRWERRKILAWVPALRAIVGAMLWPVSIAFGSGSLAFYAIVLLVLSANRFFLATMSAVLPQLVPDDDLLVANSVSQTGGSIANVVGQVAGSALSATIGGAPTGLVASGAFALTALVSRRIPVHRGLPPHRAPLLDEVREVLAEMVDGMRAVRESRAVVFGLSAVGVMQFLVGAMTAVLVYYFIAVLDLTVGAAAVILAVLAIGIGVGVVIVPIIGARVRHQRLIPASFAIAAVGTGIAASSLSRTTLIIGAGIIGTSYAFVKIPVDTIVQEHMRDVVRGRAFALYDMLFNVMRVLGVLAVAIAYEAQVSSRTIVAAIGISYAAAAIGFRSWERGGPMFGRRRAKNDAPVSFSPGELVTVRAYAGSRADEEPRAIVSGGRDVPITQIEWRAVVEESGRRARVFVVRAGGRRVRLAYHEEDGSWEIERVLPSWQEPETGYPTGATTN